MQSSKKFSAKVLNGSLQLSSPETGELLETLPIVKATSEHRNFILSTWVRSYEAHARRVYVGPTAVRMSTEAYRDGEARIAERHWEKTLCVVSGSDNYAIHAWVCGEPGKLWHVYVSPGLRRADVASELVQSVSGASAQVHKPIFCSLYKVKLIWNPWMVMQ